MPEQAAELGRRRAEKVFRLPATRGSKKHFDKVITPEAQAIHVLHTWSSQCQCNPCSCTTFMLNPLLGRAATGKKMSCVYACRITLVVPNSLSPYGLWLVRPLCHRGSPGKNTGVYWPILVAIPF